MHVFGDPAAGLTPLEERVYKVVVMLDSDVYSFKFINAGDLGKCL